MELSPRTAYLSLNGSGYREDCLILPIPGSERPTAFYVPKRYIHNADLVVACHNQGRRRRSTRRRRRPAPPLRAARARSRGIARPPAAPWQQPRGRPQARRCARNRVTSASNSTSERDVEFIGVCCGCCRAGQLQLTRAGDSRHVARSATLMARAIGINVVSGCPWRGRLEVGQLGGLGHVADPKEREA